MTHWVSLLSVLVHKANIEKRRNGMIANASTLHKRPKMAQKLIPIGQHTAKSAIKDPKMII